MTDRLLSLMVKQLWKISRNYMTQILQLCHQSNWWVLPWWMIGDLQKFRSSARECRDGQTKFPFSEIASGGGNGAQSSSDSTWRQRWFLGCGPEAGDVRFDPGVDQGARSRKSYSLASRGMLARQHYSGTNVSLDFVQKLASGPTLDAQLQWEWFKVTKESTLVYTWTTSPWWTPSTRRRRISLYSKKKITLLLLEEFWSNQHLYIPKLV